MKEIAILGLGRFGRLVASTLKNFFRLVAFDPGPVEGFAADLGVPLVPLPIAARKPVLILAAPISAMEGLLVSIAPHVRAGSLVCDTCSVKQFPVDLMKRILPEYVQILGTHPCFGPDSLQKGFAGNKIVLCPVRVRNLDAIEKFLSGSGLTVIVSTPEKHDYVMARTQVISQFLGRAVLRMGLKQEAISTTGFSQMLEILQYVRHDSDQLFRDLQNRNPFAKEMRRRLIEALMEIDRSLAEE